MSKSIKVYEIIHLSRFDGFGPKRLKYIIEATENFQSIWQADRRLILKVISEKLYADFVQARQVFNLEFEVEKIEKSKTAIIDWQSELYPEVLKEIVDCPPILFAKGNLDLLKNKNTALAVVGSRKHTFYGKMVIDAIIPELISHDIIIISGLALGIDALAHQKAISEKGKTIAILGSGLNFIYPAENQRLAADILTKNGLLVSEFPLDTPPLKQYFPRRNRIIAGLAKGVLVVEAAKDSGSLITANFALDYNRDVFAIPGDINRKNSEGANFLLKSGAKVVTGAKDILDEWQIVPRGRNERIVINNLSEKEKIIMEFIAGQKMHIDQISQELGVEARISAQLLTQLELIGLVKPIGGGYYQARNVV